jgi:hypothetical protein
MLGQKSLMTAAFGRLPGAGGLPTRDQLFRAGTD